ncbi:MAG TPA: ATP-dependent DNA helicase UvrD2 [Nocardioidaceae bacterium]|nr:ATP-dependent DNA helicase UvrD2 [Nocardioidaceae bacterium]
MPDHERLLDALDPEQREVATTLGGPVRVLAGAGTGKTRAITHRIAYGVATGVMSATEVLAVTFTTRAAGEMRARLTGLGAVGVQARTFHSAALRQARYFWPRAYGCQLPAVAPTKLRLLGEAVAACRLRADAADLRDLAGEIEWAKVSNVRPDDYAGLAEQSHRELAAYDFGSVAKVYEAYEEVKHARGRIDFEDVLLCAAAVLADDEAALAAVRRQYRWFVVDEFQDVSPIQVALLDLWLGDRADVCVVGDPAQTIYSFAGASSEPLLGFGAKYPGTTSVTLTRNYRSQPQVVTVANTVMRSRLGRGAVELRAVREAGPEVEFTAYADEVAEAEAVAGAIAAYVASGGAAGDVAVLFRVNAQSESYEAALAERGIPFSVRGAERFFERPEVRQAVALLRGAAHSGPTAAAEPGRSPAGAGDGSQCGGGLLAEVTDVLATMGWQATAPTSRGSARDRWESLQAIVALAEELLAEQPELDLAGFAEELRRRADAQHAPAAGGVTLCTLHAAKGLEWAVVHLVGMHEGTLPIAYADTPQAVEEERRLLYVGITRARDLLRVSWSAARSPGGRGQRGPSRFLDGLVAPAAAGTAPARRRPATKSLSRCRVCGRPLADPRERKLGHCADCPTSYDEGLFEALREWRRSRAAAEHLPAYCVCTDVTMIAIAERRPVDPAELVSIPGIGERKVDKYGADILAICAAQPPSHPASSPVGRS